MLSEKTTHDGEISSVIYLLGLQRKADFETEKGEEVSSKEPTNLCSEPRHSMCISWEPRCTVHNDFVGNIHMKTNKSIHFHYSILGACGLKGSVFRLSISVGIIYNLAKMSQLTHNVGMLTCDGKLGSLLHVSCSSPHHPCW